MIPLPEEIWDIIFNFMTTEEIIKLKDVNKNFYLRCTTQRKAVFDLEKGHDCKLVFHLDPRFLRTIVVKNGILPPGFIGKIAKKFINLSTLKLINIESIYTSFIPLENILNMEELDLSNTNSIYNYQLYLVGAKCKSLKKLILTNQNRIDEHIILYFLEVHPAIKYIDISRCSKINTEFLKKWISENGSKKKLIF